MTDIDVKDNSSDQRFEAYLDGELAGFAEYEITDGVVTFVHTEVDDAFEGKGVGSKLVRGALDDVLGRDDVQGVRATCPFVCSWIRRHPDYQDRVEALAEEDEG